MLALNGLRMIHAKSQREVNISFWLVFLGLFLIAYFFSGIIGNLKSLHVASLIEEKLERLPVKTKIIALAGYHEPSICVHVRGRYIIT